MNAGARHSGFLRDVEAAALTALDEFAAAGAGTDAFVELADHLPAGAALRRLADGFALEAAETGLLAFLYAAEMSEPVARRLSELIGSGRGAPLWLAQRLIPGLRAEDLSASATLRRFELVGIEETARRIEARVWLTPALADRFGGAPAAEPMVAARIAPWPPRPILASESLTARLRAALAGRGQDGLSPALLVGRMEHGVVCASLAALGLRPHVLAASDIPADPEDRDRLARLWSREAGLDASVLVILADDPAGPAAADFIGRILGHVVVAGSLPAASLRREIRILEDIALTSAGVADRWRRALGPERSDKVAADLPRIAGHFRLTPEEIDAVCAKVAGAIDAQAKPGEAGRILWRAAGRAPIAPPIAGVSLVEPIYGWDDIVLAPHIKAALERVETHVSRAVTVMDDWGFAARMGGRGRGVAALFSGPSGTGKTMAAEVLASGLDLQMMLIDLSQVISKWVGETSKNVAAAFDYAERSGAVMVWNEGDAIWGARGSVGNATDRHVNAEVGDLLQRIEAFRGFTVVTTNLRNAIDPAFLRRFRFTIDFPMPAERERLSLWSQAFPTEAPVETIDWTPLAALPLTGGNIRNIALGSAFLAAERGGTIDRGLIAAELAEELRRHNQPVPTIDWEARS